MVGLDVGQGFDVPGGGELKGTVDLVETGDQVLIEGACATSDQGVGDVTEVVADVTGTLGLTAGGGGEVVALLLGGVGILVVDGLGGAVDKFISLGGEGLGGFEGVLGALETTEGSVELGVAQVTTLGVGCGNGLGEGVFDMVEEMEKKGWTGRTERISRRLRQRDRSRCRFRRRGQSSHRG